MNRTAPLASHAQLDNVPVGRQPSPASSLVRKAVQIVSKFLRVAPAAGRSDAAPAYPWLPARSRSNMGVRARRLMRADY